MRHMPMFLISRKTRIFSHFNSCFTGLKIKVTWVVQFAIRVFVCTLHDSVAERVHIGADFQERLGSERCGRDASAPSATCGTIPIILSVYI
ncbi:unnamed protein product [Nesidiocoris tenuis]|uniref:Uncharacterized protein n=1 Tax=Nesidiocoris tenuis TaxID=355587 RepID=A0A6H5GE03_9HEMI|nr:unnamed protein product [Nesidiocoris tenuis]